MKKSRKLLMILGIVLSLAIATGSTLAYLTDTDSDVNVMTLGNVEIKQHEYERIPTQDGFEKIETDSGEGYKLQDFTQAKPLYPMVGTPTFDPTSIYFDQLNDGEGTGGYTKVTSLSNAQDKMVFVENDGKSDAYVRTLIAVEGTDKATELVGLVSDSSWEVIDCELEIQVGDSTYCVMEYIYKGTDERHPDGILPAGEWTTASLTQVILASEATNEDMEALDVNGNGLYDILVLSQAVQTAGFSDAKTALNEGFGPVNEENKNKVIEWFEQVVADGEYTPVMTYQELKDALAEGGNVLLLNDIELEGSLVLDGEYEAVLNMNGKKLTVKEGCVSDPVFYQKNGASLVITGNGTLEYDNLNANFFFVDKGTLIIENGTYTRAVDPNYSVSKICPLFPGDKDAKIIINGGYFDGGFYDENDCFESCRRNILNLTTGQYFRVYGGTFVGQNPAWGDQGQADYCPHCVATKPAQGLFLEGQTQTSTELPDGYIITETVSEDGRPVFTVKYSK